MKFFIQNLSGPNENIDFSKIEELYEIPAVSTREEILAEKQRSFDALRTLYAMETVLRRLMDQSFLSGRIEDYERYRRTANVVRELSIGEGEKFHRLTQMYEEAKE